GERVRTRTVVAGLLGFGGVALLVLRASAQLDTVGVLAGLAGAASMATGVVFTKRWGRPVPLLAFTSWQLLAGGLVLAPVALVVEGAPPAFTLENVAGYAWLATGGGAVAYALWFRGIERLPVARVSLLGLVAPVVATLAGLIVLDQTFTLAQLVGIVAVLSALWIGQRVPKPTSIAAISLQTREIAAMNEGGEGDDGQTRMTARLGAAA
ncbi:MAG TPA: EamA family transporter, partial [Acidimicrobiia bacterium]|nr:EamA family transporter [Acidimicrobiia bacterium]